MLGKGSLFGITLMVAVLSVAMYGYTHSIFGDRWDQPAMTVPQMIQYWGYKVEEHRVTTSDGYILTMHRILGKKQRRNDIQVRRPVFLAHCLLCSSAVFSFGPPQQSLGFILADAGYDVWMGNTRGNTWSKEHPDLEHCQGCESYWKFSWDDTALKDFPAEIDYILEQTRMLDLFLVGYSMGTSQYFVLLSELPEYNQKIKAGFMMAPVTSVSRCSSLALDLSAYAAAFQTWLHSIGSYGFLPSSKLFHWLAHNVCDDGHPGTEQLCADVFIDVYGVESHLLNKSMLSFYIDHLPAGCSTQSFVHYTQLKISGNDTFSRYDWGPEENMERYGQATPPEIDLTRVTAPTVLYVGDSDTVACEEDSEVLASRLPNLIGNHIIDHKGWSHLDFFMAMNVKEKVYDSILRYMDDMSEKS